MDTNVIYIMPVVLCVLVMFSAFFAMSEVAFISLNKLRLRYLLQQGRKNAQVVQRIVMKMDKLIATILVGNNFVNIAISAIGTSLFIYFFGNNVATISSDIDYNLDCVDCRGDNPENLCRKARGKSFFECCLVFGRDY